MQRPSTAEDLSDQTLGGRPTMESVVIHRLAAMCRKEVDASCEYNYAGETDTNAQDEADHLFDAAVCDFDLAHR